MSSNRVVVAGLVAGFATILVVAIAFAALGPGPVPPAHTPSPPPAVPSASMSASDGSTPSVPATPDASGSAGAAGASGQAAFHVGSPAPALRLPQLGGGTVDLAALRGKPVWIEFTATWCPSCRDDAAAMTSFAERYHDNGLVAIAVDVREDESTVTAFASSIDPTYPIALDTDGSAQRAWSVAALPTHFFIDASGVIRAGAVGTIGRDLLARSLGEIMPGVNVAP